MKQLAKHSTMVAAMKRGFTLVELLVVIAITAIILGLLFGPIISSFNLTRKARALAQAQDAARFGLERLSRELGRATYIYDNGLSPVAIPMAFANVQGQTGTFNIGDPTDAGTTLNPNNWPRIAYGRIDIVQPALRENTGDVIDPTTGQPVGGAELQPGVRGKRVTRYFLGLRHPETYGPDSAKRQRLYTNIYEFRNNRAPLVAENLELGSLNPVILYRAEYDPNDPNLFDMRRDTNGEFLNYNRLDTNLGGFNDPAFFYNTLRADSSRTNRDGTAVLDSNGNPIVGNGRTYGENWQAIAQPVLTSENLDLLRWNRVGAATERNTKDENDPFAATTTFSPTALVDDVAAPGFLSSGGVETPAAVPTSYQTKYSAWTYPFTITVLRGSTNYNGGASRPASAVGVGAEPFGTMTLTVNRDAGGNIFVSRLDAPALVPSTTNPNTLATDSASNLYTILSPASRKLFVKTPNLTFSIDPDRGRIETAFPPLHGRAGTGSGVPRYYIGVTTTIADAVPGTVPVIGELVPTRFVQDTRHPQAGTVISAGGTLPDGSTATADTGIPKNQGIWNLDLFDEAVTRYQLADGTTAVDAGTPLASPLVGFGVSAGTAAQRGIRIIPGSERVFAPVVTTGAGTAWARVGAIGGAGFQPFSQVTVPQLPVLPEYTAVPERLTQYIFNFDFLPTAAGNPLQQELVFDSKPIFYPPSTNTVTPTITPNTSSGLPAATATGVNFLTATYLWQNNFSRDPRTAAATWGIPLDANGNPVIFGQVGSRPEADIFRVDYATRQLYNINLGARIYDPTDGRVSSLQVSDKVIINNALR